MEEEENSIIDNNIDNNQEINIENNDEYNLSYIGESSNKIQENYEGNETNIQNIEKNEEDNLNIIEESCNKIQEINESNENKIQKGKNMFNYDDFNYLDKLEEKEEDKIIELFDELKLENKNNVKEKNKSDLDISEKNKNWFTYCLKERVEKRVTIILKMIFIKKYNLY